MQDRLFFEDINDALREVVQALGGAKKVGTMLWPEKTIEQSHTLLLGCLNPDRKERLTPEQVLLVLRWGRQADCHAAINYLCIEAGYAAPAPVEPEDELAQLQREYIRAVNLIATITPKIERAQVKMAAVK